MVGLRQRGENCSGSGSVGAVILRVVESYLSGLIGIVCVNCIFGIGDIRGCNFYMVDKHQIGFVRSENQEARMRIKLIGMCVKEEVRKI